MKLHECNLNIRYDFLEEIWNKLDIMYFKMPG